MPLSFNGPSNQEVCSGADSSFPGTVLFYAVYLLKYKKPGIPRKMVFSQAGLRESLAFRWEAEI